MVTDKKTGLTFAIDACDWDCPEDAVRCADLIEDNISQLDQEIFNTFFNALSRLDAAQIEDHDYLELKSFAPFLSAASDAFQEITKDYATIPASGHNHSIYLFSGL